MLHIPVMSDERMSNPLRILSKVHYMGQPARRPCYTNTSLSRPRLALRCIVAVHVTNIVLQECIDGLQLTHGRDMLQRTAAASINAKR